MVVGCGVERRGSTWEGCRREHELRLNILEGKAYGLRILSVGGFCTLIAVRALAFIVNRVTITLRYPRTTACTYHIWQVFY